MMSTQCNTLKNEQMRCDGWHGFLRGDDSCEESYCQTAACYHKHRTVALYHKLCKHNRQNDSVICNFTQLCQTVISFQCFFFNSHKIVSQEKSMTILEVIEIKHLEGAELVFIIVLGFTVLSELIG